MAEQASTSSTWRRMFNLNRLTLSRQSTPTDHSVLFPLLARAHSYYQQCTTYLFYDNRHIYRHNHTRMESESTLSAPPPHHPDDRIIPPKSRALANWHNKTVPRARWVLHLQAVFWRVLMGLGMFFHRLAPPRPPKPSFTRYIPSTIAGQAGQILLHFYVPRDYHNQRNLYTRRPIDGDEEEGEEEEGGKGKARRFSQTFDAVSQSIRRRTSVSRRWGGYPVVINFHGGGFTLGSATDDARWCGTVVEECHAVVISVDYRLAPEHPFPTAVEDGADAVLWVHKHAEELGVDADKIALSGFSSGANMAFSVPLRLYDEIHGFPRDSPHDTLHPHHGLPTVAETPSSSTTNLQHTPSNVVLLNPNDPPPEVPRNNKNDYTVEVDEQYRPDISIRCVVPWYPSLDYTRTREERRATCVRKDQELPAVFTDLFDESYLHPPQNISLDSPYLSPGVAPTELLNNALPQEIIMHTCEWDMLLDEGVAFKNRLVELGKEVHYKMVEGVPHGWDKAPNPWKPTPGVREHYLRACKELRRVFGETQYKERQTEAGPSAASRGSISLVR